MPANRPLRLAVSALTALVLGAFALSTWRDHDLSRREAERELTEIVRLMDEHTGAALELANLLALRVCDIIGERAPRQVGGADDHARLLRLTRELPSVDSVWVFDADGAVRASSYDLPAGGFNVGDRPYYQALRDGAAGFISPLFWGRLRHEPFFAVSRRLDHADGSFAGGIQVSIKASYLTDFYRSLSSQPGAVFAIYKDDGSLVMRSVLPSGQESFPTPTILLEHLGKAPSGTYQAVTVYDDVDRLWAYRRIEGKSMVVVTGVPMTQVLAGWRERTLRNGIIATVVLAAFLTIARALAETLRREATLRARAEGLLAEKDMLFQEIHHRVKNNLQIIASFLTMQAVHSRDAATAAAFEEALSRLQSMGLVHQILYEQHEATEVSMEAYLRALGCTIGQTFGADSRGITIEVAPSDARLAMDQAVPLALLANEALTNALKHAFPPGRCGSIHMELAERDGALAFSLADDGIGMPEGAKSGLGMTILSALARQLGGTLEWAIGPGTRLTVTVPV